MLCSGCSHGISVTKPPSHSGLLFFILGVIVALPIVTLSHGKKALGCAANTLEWDGIFDKRSWDKKNYDDSSQEEEESE